jgi:transposase-like protein
LIDLLNAGKAAMLVKPELTAFWEKKMTQIEEGKLTLDSFISEVGTMVGEIVEGQLEVPEISGVSRKKKCLTAGCEGYLRHITKVDKGKKPFFACPVCKNTFNDRDGEPIERRQANEQGEKAEKIEADCPLSCGKKARRLQGPYGFFWKCDCLPEKTFRDVDGKPMVKEERPQQKCPVKNCKGTAQQFKTKDGTRFFWRCATCQNMFNDVDGKPVIRKKESSSSS